MNLDDWTSFLPCCKFYQKSSQLIRDHFWKKNLERDNTLTFKKFTRERDFVLLENGGDSSVLTIGLDPENRFKVTGRLQVLRSGSIILNECELNILLELIDERQSNVLQSDDEDHILFQEYKLCIFEMGYRGKKVGIDEKSLEALYRMQEHIDRYISLLKAEAPVYERSFFKLLEHFYRGKTVQETLDVSETEFLQCFFHEMEMEAPCLDIDRQFVLDMASRFEKFFIMSLPNFIKSMMVNESERIRTFSKNWPYSKDYISIKNMAMCGLYFTGVEDKVMCAFCPVIIYEWSTEDVPIVEHYKHYKHCRLLRDPKRALNVSDISSERELMDLLSRLPTRVVDEVDEYF